MIKILNLHSGTKFQAGYATDPDAQGMTVDVHSLNRVDAFSVGLADVFFVLLCFLLATGRIKDIDIIL